MYICLKAPVLRKGPAGKSRHPVPPCSSSVCPGWTWVAGTSAVVQAEAGSQRAPLASRLCSPVASSRRRATPTIAAVGRWCSSWSASRSASTANTWFAPAFRCASLHHDHLAPAAWTQQPWTEGGSRRRRAPVRGIGARTTDDTGDASLRGGQLSASKNSAEELGEEQRRSSVGPLLWRKWRRPSRFRRQTAGTVVLEATTRRTFLVALISARVVVPDVVTFHRFRRTDFVHVVVVIVVNIIVVVVVVVVVAIVAVSVVGYLTVVTVEPSAVGWWWNTAPRHTHPI